MWLLLCAAAQLAAVSTAPATALTTSPAPMPAPPWAIDGVDIAEVIDGLSLEQKVGQTLLLGFGGTVMDGTIERFIDEMQPGGVALFTRNIAGPEQTMALIAALRKKDPRVGCADDAVACPATVPMFVSVDQEGGSVVRLKKDAVILPSPMALGAADDPELAYRVGRALGEDLVLWGFNMNLAPVLDVSSNPKNPVIGVRSFGGDPNRVSDIGVGYIEGLGDAGVVAVAKHFPGHGDTDTDSHYALPVLQHDLTRLHEIELRPFARAFSAGLPAIMTAHIALPLIAEGKDVPATVSGKVLTGVLREDLGWDGLVITDGLEMQGIIDRYGAGEAAVRAVVAGADMVMVLWFPEKKIEVQRALLDAVKSGRLPMARLDQAVRRVLEQKARAGLFSRATPSPSAALSALRGKDRAALQETVERAITIVRNDDGLLPLKKPQKVVVAAAQTAFVQGLQKSVGAKPFMLSWAPTRDRTQKDAAKVVGLARSSGADVVVIGMHTGDHIAVVRAVEAALPKVKVVVVSFGSPWLLNAFPHSEATVCAFGWRDDSAAAAAAVVAGVLPARGRMPVALASAGATGDAPSSGSDRDVAPGGPP
jgi:beta-N-acetylhexosaminidase